MFKELNILKPFFEYPTREYNVREAARILKLSPATASKKLKELEKIGLLKQKKVKNFIFYSANLDNEFYRDTKIFYNIRKIKDSPLLEEINKFYLKPTVVLFGSAAFGLDTDTSDIDLLVISEKTSEFGHLKDFEKFLNRRLQFFVVEHLRDLKNKHLINNVLSGIILQGEIKWK